LKRLLIALALHAGVAQAQDFASATHAGAGDEPCVTLERGLPAASSGFAASVAQTRWWNLSDLETRAAAVAAGWRSVRGAFGVSQTGAPEIGWTTMGVAAGAATAEAGAAFRACARLDRDASWSLARAASHRAGVEAGGGAWLAAAPGVRVWASAPQMLVRGTAPPLARELEIGVRLGGDTGGWAVLRAPRAGDDGERAIGVALAVDPVIAWAEMRDAPLRGAAGLAAAIHAFEVDARVDEHHVLGETVRVALTWRGGAQ